MGITHINITINILQHQTYNNKRHVESFYANVWDKRAKLIGVNFFYLRGDLESTITFFFVKQSSGQNSQFSR